MKPEEQRIAIAEACGAEWTTDKFGNRMLVDKKRDVIVWIDVHGGADFGLPNYLSDLNAMHGAEKVLHDDHSTGNQWSDYISLLDSISDEESPVHATAAQRAEAFLRTLGKWVE